MSERRFHALLGCGAALGLAAAVWSAIDPASLLGARLPAGAVATVNGRVIGAQDLADVVAGLAADKRAPLTAADREHVLARLIDEELLLQRGIERGLVARERSVRKAVVAAVVDSVVAEARAAVPSESELREFYEANAAYFAGSPRMRVRQLLFRERNGRPLARTRASRAASQLADGGDFDSVAADLADDSVDAVPEELLQTSVLRRYVGASAMNAIASLHVGGRTGVLPAPGGHQIIELLELEAGVAPELDTIKDSVVQEWSRREAERALAEYVAWLRTDAEILTRTPAP